MNTKYATALVCLAFGLTGCSGQKGDKFALPKGNPDRGQEVFLHFRCYDCHSVSGVELPVGEEANQIKVELGRLKTQPHEYSDLVMAIINPSHRLAKGYTPLLVSTEGKSRMTVYNDVMTVSQLIDLVAFLQSHYELRPHEQGRYPDYYGP